jgi:hypothetical protein
MTPAEELAAAADKLDALASGATQGPQFADEVMLASIRGTHEEDAAYIAAMNPLVGKALAVLLRAFAGAVAREYLVFHEMWNDEQRLRSMATHMDGLHEALDLARLINGSES